MKKLTALLLVVTILSGIFAGCKPDTADEPKVPIERHTITDAHNRQVEVPMKVESIVCVGVGALRYTCYVGAADLVVGVEDYEVKPGMSRLYNYVNFDKFKDLRLSVRFHKSSSLSNIEFVVHDFKILSINI